MKVIASMLLLAADASRVRRKVVNEHLKSTGPDPTYQEWAGQYGFNSDDEKMAETYQANLDTLAKVRADHPEAEFGVNQFYGMSWNEFSSTMLTVKPDTLLESDFPVFESSLADLTELADEVMWDVTPVKDQGQCGSCWAFAAMASIEHGHKVKTGGTDVSLAEQQLMDCSGSECQGGWPPSAMDFLKDSPIFTTQSYPYKARKGTCQKGDDSGVRIYGHIAVGKSESALLQALQKQAVVVQVMGDEAFGSYKAGVIDGTTVCDINHAVAATGYTSEFIKLKNSWGTGWGESGYIRVKRTTSGCGPFGLYAYIPSLPAMTAAKLKSREEGCCSFWNDECSDPGNEWCNESPSRCGECKGKWLGEKPKPKPKPDGCCSFYNDECSDPANEWCNASPSRCEECKGKWVKDSVISDD